MLYSEGTSKKLATKKEDIMLRE